MTKISVLLLDDDAASRIGIAKYLRVKAEFKVKEFKKGKKALEHLKTSWQNYTAVLLDYVLESEFSGEQVIDSLRENFPTLPVVVFTGKDPIGGIQTLDRGAYASMQRPLDFVEMENIIRDLARQDMILMKIANDAIDILNSDVCLVWRLDRMTHQFRIAGWAGALDRDYREKVTLDFEDKKWQKFLAKGKPLYISDVKDPSKSHWYRFREEAVKYQWTSLITIPLTNNNLVVGLIDSYTYDLFTFPDETNRRETMRFLSIFANQAVEAVRYTELSRRTRVIQELTQTLASSLDENSILRSILLKALELVGADFGWLYTVDTYSGKLFLQGWRGVEKTELEEERKLGEGITGLAAQTGVVVHEPFMSPEAVQEEMCSTIDPEIESASAVAVPLRRGELTIGVITAISRFPNHFTDEDIDLMLFLAAHATVAIQQVKLAKHLQEVSRLALVADEFSELASYVVESVQDLTGSSVNLWMMSKIEEEGDNYMRIVASSEDMPENFTRTAVLPTAKGSSINAHALHLKKAIIVDDIFNISSNLEFIYIQEAKQLGWHSFMAVPLLGRGKEHLGVLSLYSKWIARFGESESQFIQTLANQASIAFQQRKQALAMSQLAHMGKEISLVSEEAESLLEHMVILAQSLTGADCIVIYPYDPFKKRFYQVEHIAAIGLINPKDIKDKPRETGLAALVRKHGEIIVYDLDSNKIEIESLDKPEKDPKEVISTLTKSKFVDREEVRAFVGVSLRTYERGQRDPSQISEVGVIFINFRAPHHFTQEELQIIRIYANHVANVIRSNRLFYKTQRQAIELEALHQSALKIISRQEINERLNEIVESAILLLKGKGGKVYLRVPGEDYLVLVAARGIDSNILKIDDRLAFGEGMAGQVIISKKPLMVEDYSQWDGKADRFSALFTAIIEAPLMLGDEAIGVIGVFDDVKKRQFTDDDSIILERLARQAALTINNASINQESQKRYELVNALYQIGIKIIQHLNVEEVTGRVLDEFGNVIDFSKATIQLFQGDERKLVAFRGFDKERIDQWLLRSISSDSLVHRIVKTREPVILTDPHIDPDWEVRPWTEDVRSWAGIPLIYGDEVIGLLTLDHDKKGYYSTEDSTNFKLFANQAAIAIKISQLYEDLEQHTRQLEELHNVSLEVSSEFVISQLLSSISVRIWQLLKADSVTIFPYVGSTEYFSEGVRVGRGQGRIPAPSRRGDAGNAVKNLNPVYSFAKDHEEQLFIDGNQVLSYAGIPLLFEKECVGLLFINYFSNHTFDPREKKLAQLFGLMAAAAIHKARVFEEANRRIRNLEISNNIIQMIISQSEEKLSRQLQNIVSQTTEKLGCTHCTIFCLKEVDGETWLIPNVTDGPQSEFIMSRRFKPGEGVAGWAFVHDEVVKLADAREDERFLPARREKNRPRSMLVAPIKVVGQNVGVFCADQDEKNWFHEDDVNLLKILSAYIGIIIERDRRRNEQLDAVRRDYVQDVAHQLVGPLGGLRAHAENLLEGRLSVERGITVLATIVEQAGLLQRYAENFSLASRGMHSIFEPTEYHPKIIDSKQLVRLLINFAKSFQGQAKSKGIIGPNIDEVSFRNFPPVRLDEDLFEILILNLYDNAVKYSYDGSPIDIKGHILKSELEIEIINHGIPLYQEEIPTLFKRYSRTKAAEEHVVLGTGIGLFICYHIAKLHGGHIRVLPSKRSIHGNEVRFIITLPKYAPRKE